MGRWSNFFKIGWDHLTTGRRCKGSINWQEKFFKMIITCLMIRIIGAPVFSYMRLVVCIHWIYSCLPVEFVTIFLEDPETSMLQLERRWTLWWHDFVYVLRFVFSIHSQNRRCFDPGRICAPGCRLYPFVMEHSTQEKKRYKWLLNAIEIRNRLATLGDIWYDEICWCATFNHRWVSMNIP